MSQKSLNNPDPNLLHNNYYNCITVVSVTLPLHCAVKCFFSVYSIIFITIFVINIITIIIIVI